MEYITKSAQSTFNLGKKIGNYLTSSSERGDIVICLYGELGSGKTTFIQGLAKGLGISHLVPSPTFIIVRHYGLTTDRFSSFYHIDLYRLEDEKELEGLGLNGFFSDPASICAVEWAEKLKKYLPKKRIDIRFEIIDTNKRKITIVPNLLKKAIKVLNQGGIVIFPTDTAFGVGCRIDNIKACERLFNLRKRPKTQAVPILVSSITQAQLYLASFSNIVRRLIMQYWPGPLTVVYQCKKNTTPQLIRGNGDTLGVRMPNHQIILKLISAVGVPILGPSANFHKEPTPYRFEDLDPEFTKLVDLVIPGECPLGNVSTVIDCTKKPFKIIRQGAQVIDKYYLK